MWVYEWTGEQFLPAIKDPSFVYQHLHRYAYAAEVLTGKRVLDLIAGDGSGANILAQTAASVVAIVVDDRFAQHAVERYKKPNIQFVSGSIAALPIADGDSFDAITCFGQIDDKVDYAHLLVAVKRLLKQDGLFMLCVRSPEDAKGDQHANGIEKFRSEKLQQFLAAYFRDVQILGQHIYANSHIWAIAPERNLGCTEIVMARADIDEFQRVRGQSRIPSYLIAIASNSALATQMKGSVFVDEGNELLADKDKVVQELTESKAYQANALQWCETQLAARRESLASLQEGFAWQKSEISSLIKTRDFLESEITHYKNTIASHEEALAWRASQVEERDAALEELKKSLEDLQRASNQLQTERDHLQTERDQLQVGKADLLQTAERATALALELDAIKHSTGWNFVLGIRWIRDSILPAGTLRRRVYDKIIGSAKTR